MKHAASEAGRKSVSADGSRGSARESVRGGDPAHDTAATRGSRADSTLQPSSGPTANLGSPDSYSPVA